MPILRLRKHQANFSDEDILINPSDFNGLKLNDVVELKPPKGGNLRNRILLQVRKWPETNQSYQNCVSIKDSVANAHLQLYADVLVNVVDKNDVLVDSIEICFSNAYLARSYMWGLRNHLNNRCVYQRQKLDYLHIRSQICEIWAQGNKVSSGYVDDDTKIVFRSASSLVYLFIQMSSEMWDYDINGDLYCEKAINGFLTDLFDTWRRNDCSHDITIVLFSRTFYDAESLEEFPEEMRECLQVDYKNRFYEDCYRVAFQNDRFDLHDWNAKLTTLKSLFNQYQKEVIDRHQEKYSTKIPRAYNSSAAQGNFLEVLNMSLNVFEKHYFDRSFDRTGQLSVVVSPGVGVFEVDFEMTNLTKQRIIDNGIGSDLVCLGEQPLHTVPLLKFNSKSSQFDDNLTTCDVYNMPHWINLSFYSSENQVYYSNFIPRIKLPTLNTNKLKTETSKSTITAETHLPTRTRNESNTLTVDDNTARAQDKDRSTGQATPIGRHQSHSGARAANANGHHQFSSHPSMPDLVDYDDYDAQVFKANSMVTYHCQQQASRGERSILGDIDANADYLSDTEDDFLERDNRNKSASIQRRSSDVKNYQEYSRNMKRQISENLPIVQSRANSQQSHHNHHHHHLNHQTTFTRMSLVDSYLTDVKVKPESADDLSVRGYNVQSSRLNRSTTRPKALINPFDPSHMTIKLTPNRRRWTHVFPQGPTGTFIQQHHYQPVPQKSASPYLADVSPPPIAENEPFQVARQNCNLISSRPTPDTLGGLSPRLHPPGRSPTGALTDNKLAGLSGFGRRAAVDSLSMMSPSSAAAISVSNLNKEHNKSTLVSNDTIRFAWCASGEQEWTPAITTGVDWKSLTMPACLPLTTDFFPSKTSLQNDYVIGEYNIDSSCIHSRYKLIEVYRELVCQRLQKGFQIILLPRQSKSAGTSATQASSLVGGGGGSGQPSRHSSSGSSMMSMRHHQRTLASLASSSSSADSDLERERTEYTMSIGRIFHKLSLNGNTITVTQYRPRHPYPTIKIDYCYRFRAPFHETYGQSWVHFKSEKLENYSWNYLDNYICARGESFELRSSLKFWRFRILILPSKLCLRKLPHASAAGEENNGPDWVAARHDVYYGDFSQEERNSLMESFKKLLEIINKTRRASACRASSSSSGFPSSSSSSSGSTSSGGLNGATSNGSNNKQQPPNAPQPLRSWPTRLRVQIGTSGLDEQGGSTESPPSSATVMSSAPSSGQRSASPSTAAAADKTDDANSTPSPTGDTHEQLHFRSINMDIDSALRDARRSEWVHVQYHCFYEINQAFEFVIKWMVASGAGIAEMVQGWSRKVGNSSVHVVPIPWEPFAMPHSGKADPLRCPIGIQLGLNCLPGGNSLDDSQVIKFQERILRRFGFIQFHDLISTENIERQYVHMSGFAFVALPNLLGDENNQENTANGGQFGATCSPSGQSARATDKQQPHLSISRSPTKSTTTTTTTSSKGALHAKGKAAAAANLKLVHQDTISSPHEEYITRHIGGARQNKVNRLRAENEQIEFIWSWNYMLTKRWRSPSTQDESYAVSLLADFKDFCANGDNRLTELWSEVKESLLA